MKVELGGKVDALQKQLTDLDTQRWTGHKIEAIVRRGHAK